MLTVHLPDDLERYVEVEVQGGRFASADEAITEALAPAPTKRAGSTIPRRAALPDEVNRQLLEAGLLSRIPARP